MPSELKQPNVEIQSEENIEMATKKWMTLIAMLFVLSLVAGCGAAPTAAPQPQTGAEEPAEGAAEGPVVVQYWSNGWFPSSISGRKALVDKFNQEHAGEIQVEYIQGSWDDQATYIQSGAAAGGGIACVMETGVPDAHDFYRKGYVQSLAPYLTDERRALADEIQWEARTYPEDGAIVANATVLGEPILTLLYNPDALEKAGIEPATPEDPWTWQELIDNGKLLTLDANGKHLGEEGFDPAQVVQWGYVARLEAEKVWENGMLFAQARMGQPVVRQENGKWGWYLDEGGQEVYETFLSSVKEGVSPPEAVGLGGDALHQMFADGKAAIILRETFAIPIIHDNFPDAKIGVMPIPANPGDHVFYAAGGEGMVMTKNCPTPEEAAEFMFFVMQPENAAVYAYGNGMLPGNLEGMEQEPFKSDPNYDTLRAYLEKAESFSVPFNPHLVEFAQTVVQPTLVEVAAGNMTFDEAEKVIEEQAEAILNQP
jgi:multiple sugar transport system substrate-binding protein